MRSLEDIEALLNSRIYRMGCIALKLWGYCDGILRFLRYRFRRLYQNPIGVAGEKREQFLFDRRLVTDGDHIDPGRAHCA